MPLLFQDKQQSKAWYSEDLCYPAHLHAAVELGYIQKGTCTLRVEGKEYLAEQGDLILIFPDQIHSYGTSPSKTLICTVPVGELSAFASVFREQVPANPVCKKGKWESGGLKTLLDLLAGDMEREQPAVLQGYYQAIIGKCLSVFPMSKLERTGSDDLRKLLTYINMNRTENITRAALAKTVGISESAVSRLFSDVLKMSLPDYLKSIRLGDAAKLLRETRLSVTQIAELSGFGSIRSFNRAFLEQFHVSPSAYRQSK